MPTTPSSIGPVRPGGRTPERCIVFLHIPKTGGVTLRRALMAKYSPRMLFLESLTEPLERIAATVPGSDRSDALVVSGHLHYGVHRYIPKRCDYITLLREPVSRVISMYHYIRGDPRHWLHAQLVGSGMGLEEFVKTCADPGVDNQQTRLISGRGSGEWQPGSDPPSVDREALEQAKRNLEGFLVVGVNERFDESFIMISRALGWRLPFYVTSNVTSQAKPASDRARALIRERNRLDFELYEFARTRFEAAVAAEGASFRREVTVFRAFNWIPEKLVPHTPARVRRRVRSRLPR
jgi:Galactose-3-O-sulfotransferase